MVALSYILNQSRVNASTIWALSKGIDPKKVHSFSFEWNLAKSLVTPQVRWWSLNGLSNPTQLKVQLLFGNIRRIQVEEPSVRLGTRYRSFLGPDEKGEKFKSCKERFVGKPNYKANKNRHNLKSQCQACAEPQCAKHLLHICANCAEHKFETM